MPLNEYECYFVISEPVKKREGKKVAIHRWMIDWLDDDDDDGDDDDEITCICNSLSL